MHQPVWPIMATAAALLCLVACSTRSSPAAVEAEEEESRYDWNAVGPSELLALFDMGTITPLGDEEDREAIQHALAAVEPVPVPVWTSRYDVRWLGQSAVVVRWSTEIDFDVYQDYYGLERLDGAWIFQAHATRSRVGCGYPTDF